MHTTEWLRPSGPTFIDDIKLFFKAVVLGTPVALMIGAGLALVPVYERSPPTPTISTVVPPTTETETETETMLPRHALTETPSTIAPPPSSPVPSPTSTTPEPEPTVTTTTPPPPTTEVIPDPEVVEEAPEDVDFNAIHTALVAEFIQANPLDSVFISV